MTVTTASSMPDGVAGNSYSAFVASCSPVANSASASGSYPPGLTLTPDFYGGKWYLTGTPTRKGTFTFTITFTNNGPPPTSASTTTLTVKIRDGHLIMRADYHLAANRTTGHLLCGLSALPSITTPPTLPKATPGSPYSFTMSAAGGTPGYTWSVVAGAFPSGISMSSGGVISGTSLSTGSFTVYIMVTDALGQTASSGFVLNLSGYVNISFDLTFTQVVGNYVSLMVQDPDNNVYSPRYMQRVDDVSGVPDYVWSEGYHWDCGGSTVSGNGGTMPTPSFTPYTYIETVLWQGVSSPSGVYYFWMLAVGCGYAPYSQAYTLNIRSDGTIIWTEKSSLACFVNTLSVVRSFNITTGVVANV